MRSHPFLTLTSIAAIVTILAVVIPSMFWLAAQFQTSSKAEAADQRNMRRDAWAAYNIARLEALLLRNRVNECDEKTAARRLSPPELASCQQYRREFDDATKRANDLLLDAKALGKN